MTVHLYVLYAFMIYRIHSYLNGTSIITMKWVGSVGGNPSSEIRPCNHIISERAADMALYSAFVEDLEIQSCFLHFQEIKASPKKMHQPVVDFLVSGQPA